MTWRWAALSGLMLGLVLLPSARADPPEDAQLEINYLLAYVEISGCEFYRNGSWYDSAKAQAHLRDKYNYLVARNRISTAEEFIDQAATRSSLSAQAYEVRCGGGCDAMTTGQWLHNVLTRYRIYTARLAGPLSAE